MRGQTLKGEVGEVKETIDHYRETLKLKPDLVLAQKNLKTALFRSQEIE
jgi:hypothetical protein